MKRILALVVFAVAMSAAAAGAQPAADISIARVPQPPKVDGILDDEAWKIEPLKMAAGEWVSYQPVRGDKMPEAYRTEVRVAYDDRNVYFAFHCFDNEPEKIRTNVTRRDGAFNDDWIAMSLDSAGTGQSAYHLFSNPSGSQMDAINTSASGEQFDADVVWYSVAKTTSDGYVVEIQVPLQTLRFKGGDTVRMGLVFFRKVSRIGVSYSWPEMLPGQWVFDRPSHITFSNLKPRRLVEVLPSVTYGVRQERESAAAWSAADSDAHVGASGKFGITSGVTLDATVNPDFSQVESDAFQVQVNQRFPIFFSEKRPFFMEGMGLFNIARGNNMRTAVHTRRIVDPVFGAKLTGTIGKTTFGVLNALDDHPGDVGDRGDDFADRDKLFTIGRATYALRRSDYVGGIITQTTHKGRNNLATGADFIVRPSSAQSMAGMFLTTRTSDGSTDTHGNAAQVTYEYETRRFQTIVQGEHYDRDFQMDTAFYFRTGFTGAWGNSQVSFYPHGGKNFWLQRITPFVFAKAGHDQIQEGDEHFIDTGVRFNFTRQGNLSVEIARGKEAWQGQQYNVGNDVFVFAGMQALRWLNAYGGVGVGPAIYYDEVNPFQGRSLNSFYGVTIQPNQHLSESIEGNSTRFDRASNGERVYSVDVLNSRTTYQFDKHFLVRFLAQYDSSEHRLLTDFLGSYEFVPGTVFHAGYGSLYERGRLSAFPADANGPVRLDEKYRATNRGLFFKASYLRRF
ncbi:MAG TPA: DUF5916 domain-containing protein [Vicinamibacterales bacterium]|nr:DUF5916 domain-containing protein [Vicinamibacterales bacterium]